MIKDSNGKWSWTEEERKMYMTFHNNLLTKEMYSQCAKERWINPKYRENIIKKYKEYYNKFEVKEKYVFSQFFKRVDRECEKLENKRIGIEKIKLINNKPERKEKFRIQMLENNPMSILEFREKQKKNIGIVMKNLEVLKKISGSNCHLWCGGISFELYSLEWKESLRKRIRERDNYTCIICNKYGKVVHHIDYNKMNCDETNLINLCEDCHRKTNKDREYWKEFFIKIISEKYESIKKYI